MNQVPPMSQTPPISILLAEDDADTMNLLTQMLEDEGFKVYCCENGEEALNKLKNIKPNLIISDILMPKMDGFDLCIAVKRDSVLADIPFIFHTATYVNAADRELADLLGADRFVVEPILPASFLDIINTVLKEYEQQPVKESGDIDLGKVTEIHTRRLGDKLDRKILELSVERNVRKTVQQRFNGLVTNLPDEYFFYRLSSSGHFLYVSPSIRQVLGYSESQIVSRHYTNLLANEPENTAFRHGMDRLLEGKMSGDCKEALFLDSQGVSHFLRLAQVIVFDDKGVVESVEGVAHDLSALKSVEKALRRSQKMDAIGQLTGGIAHDFNNILSIILGNASLLEMQCETDEKALKRIGNVINAAQRAADLTQQLLNFSRSKVTKSTVANMNRVIETIDSLVVHSVTAEVNVVYHLDENVWLTDVDTGDFQDVLINMIINARDAMLGGGVITLETSNETIDKDFCADNPGAIMGEYVCVSVSDNGAGISKEQQEIIFEPFYTTKESGKGTGLGLAMVYGFVKRSGGCITVESETNIGTTFKIYLPRAIGGKVEPDPENSDTIIEQVDACSRGSETILVVDDEEEILELERVFLSDLGYEVFTAKNAKEALIKLDENSSIVLMISDVVMPGELNGYQLAASVTKARPEIKILLTSGYTQRAGAAINKESVRHDILKKPYSQTELAGRIRALLDDNAT